MFSWTHKLRSERLGLTMIGGSLLVVSVMVALLARYQHAADLDRISTRGLSLVQLIAALVLLIFLLTSSFYLLLRREIRPLRLINRQIVQQTGQPTRCQRSHPFKLTLGDELSDCAANFNSFFKTANAKIARLENERASMLASSKIVNYKFNQFEAMLEALPDGLIVLDESGSAMFANARLRPLLGVAAKDVLSRPLGAWCNNSELLHFIARCQKSQSVAISPVDIAIQQGDLSRCITVSAHPLFAEGDQHKLLGRLLVLRDSSKEAAARTSRDQFVAHLSHELKTPLHTMGAYIEELQGAAANDEAFRVEGLNVLHDETERMTGLINNILSITKIENGSLAIDRQRVRLADLLNDILTTVQRGEMSKGIRFISNIPTEVSAVAIDKHLMRVAINNLLTNAIKYNRPGGEVTLQLEELQESVRIAVKDSGIGISAADQPRIFEKFYRSEADAVRQCSGHGLGLALVRDIVGLHNGKISVNSQVDQGTEVVIEFYKESEQLRKAN